MELSVTLIIVIVTSLVSIAGFYNHQVIDKLIFYPPAVTQRNEWYRYFSCGLIHADAAHLIFNMLSLYLFGEFVEGGFRKIFGEDGKWLYLVMYVTAMMVSLVPTFFKHRRRTHYRSLGASGAVSAVVFAGLILEPTVGVMLFFIPIPIPGFIFAPLFLLLSALLERKGDSNINHSAHFWGAVYGLAFVILVCTLVSYPILEHMVEDIKLYMQAKGWI
jgi:membrane associated rhomboid family serine protease